jgi:hypothetical protein
MPARRVDDSWAILAWLQDEPSAPWVIEGQYLVGGTRVSLDSLVYLFREGMSAESIVDSYRH